MDQQAFFLELLKENHGRWRAIARSYAGQDAEDLFQEILLQIWRSLRTFRGKSAISTWCYRVALNTAMSWQRSERTRRQRLPILEDYNSAMVPSPTDKHESSGILQRLLAELSPADRAILLLFLDNVSYSDMPQILEPPKGDCGFEFTASSNNSRNCIKDKAMSLDDIQRRWQSEVNQPVSSTEMQQVLFGVQQRYEGLERSAHRRDVREILAVVFVVPAFAAMWPFYRSSLVASLGVAIIMLGGAVIVYVLLSSRKRSALSFNASVLEFSRQRLAWLDGQINLLQTMAWWYVASGFVGSLLVLWGSTGGRRLVFRLLALFDVAVVAQIIYANKRAARHQLQPIREEVARLIEVLETTNTH